MSHPQQLGLFATADHDVHCLIDPKEGTSQIGIISGILVQSVRDTECGFFIDSRSEVVVIVDMNESTVRIEYTPRYSATLVTEILAPMSISSQMGQQQTKKVNTKSFSLEITTDS